MDRVRINILSAFLTKGTQLSPGKEGRLNERDKKEMEQETGGGRRGERETSLQECGKSSQGDSAGRGTQAR